MKEKPVGMHSSSRPCTFMATESERHKVLRTVKTMVIKLKRGVTLISHGRGIFIPTHCKNTDMHVYVHMCVHTVLVL